MSGATGYTHACWADRQVTPRSAQRCAAARPPSALSMTPYPRALHIHHHHYPLRQAAGVAVCPGRRAAQGCRPTAATAPPAARSAARAAPRALAPFQACASMAPSATGLAHAPAEVRTALRTGPAPRAAACTCAFLGAWSEQLAGKLLNAGTCEGAQPRLPVIAGGDPAQLHASLPPQRSPSWNPAAPPPLKTARRLQQHGAAGAAAQRRAVDHPLRQHDPRRQVCRGVRRRLPWAPVNCMQGWVLGALLGGSLCQALGLMTRSRPPAALCPRTLSPVLPTGLLACISLAPCHPSSHAFIPRLARPPPLKLLCKTLHATAPPPPRSAPMHQTVLFLTTPWRRAR